MAAWLTAVIKNTTPAIKNGKMIFLGKNVLEAVPLGASMHTIGGASSSFFAKLINSWFGWFSLIGKEKNGKGDLQEGTSPATTTSTVLGPRKCGQVTNEGNLTSTGDILNPTNDNVTKNILFLK